MAVWVADLGLVILVAYLFGSLPTGYWAGRLLKGIDIREHGSKSTGATNVLRTVGKAPAVFVLLIDLLKGSAAVVFARWFYSLPSTASPAGIAPTDWLPWMITLAALMAILGHSRSVWIQFTGGKSAATGLGVLLAMCWQVGLGILLVFGLVLAVSRIVSLGSIAAAVAAALLMWAFGQPLGLSAHGLNRRAVCGLAASGQYSAADCRHRTSAGPAVEPAVRAAVRVI